MKLLIYFLIFAFSGMVFETLSTAIGDSIRCRKKDLLGRCSLWMLPIYGVILFIVIFVQQFFPHYPWWLRGILYAVLITCWEFISGSAIKGLFHVKPWDYASDDRRNGFARKKKYHYKGIICLEYLPVWFIMGLVAEALYFFLQNHLTIYNYFVSAKFGPLMIFIRPWFA